MSIRTVALTRPEEQGEASHRLLMERGFEVIEAPTIEIREIRPKPNFSPPDLSIFMSISSVKFLPEMPKSEIIAVGPSTARALRARGVSPILPREYSSQGVIDIIPAVKGRRVAIFHSDKGAPLKMELEKRGALVDDVTLYKIALPKNRERIEALIEKGLKGEVAAYIFTCYSCFSNLMRVAGDRGRELRNYMNSSVVAAIGGSTRRAIEEQGVKVRLTPSVYTFSALVEALASLRW
jgi:uroporphyrinogen-III synthase